MFGLLALHSSFVLAVDMDLVVERLPGVRLEANYFGQDMENQVMHSNFMDPKPSLTLEQNFA